MKKLIFLLVVAEVWSWGNCSRKISTRTFQSKAFFNFCLYKVKLFIQLKLSFKKYFFIVEKLLHCQPCLPACYANCSTSCPCRNNWQTRRKYWQSQSRQSAWLFLPSSELGLPHPLIPPLVQGGGASSLAGPGVGVQIPTRGQTLWYCRYIFVSDNDVISCEI